MPSVVRGTVEGIEFGRLVAFTDGVFAIAITLLVLNFELPADPNAAPAEVNRYLGQLWGHVGAYFLTFAVVGRLWMVHHRLFATLTRFDQRLMVLNLVYLSLIVLIPFPADLLGEYGEQTAPVVIYAGVLASAALVNWLMARHASRAGLVHPDHRTSTAPWGGREALVIPAVFAASIPVAFVHPLAAELMWTGLVIGRVVVALRSPKRRRR